MTDTAMDLRVLTPERVLVETRANKVIGEGLEGSFCLLPRHVDYVATLVPGILAYFDSAGEHWIAVDEGVLVKQGPGVRVSVMNAVTGEELQALRQTVDEQFRHLNEQEQNMRTALTHLQASALRHFTELEAGDHGAESRSG